MKKFALMLSALLLALCFSFEASASGANDIYPLDFGTEEYWRQNSVPAAEYKKHGDAKALLLMEYSTGKVLFKENEQEHLPIASVTKIMSTLLVMEALDSGKIKLTDNVTVSKNASSMGGSQIFLSENENMSVEDLLKSLVVVSANDATVALAEYVCGSEETFVSLMNSRALELGCENTHFSNTNGLPVENHYSCAYDVALMTRELMKHRKIFDYTSIWMDTIRNGTFGLANTNRLIRFYKGATGMKTGFTGEAKYCLSGTAKRNNTEMIAVVLGASTSDIRFAEAKAMLDFGFANYETVTPEVPKIEPLKVKKGKVNCVDLVFETPKILLEKGSGKQIDIKIDVCESIEAPFEKGTEAGRIIFSTDGREIASCRVKTETGAEKIGYFDVFSRILSKIFVFF